MENREVWSVTGLITMFDDFNKAYDAYYAGGNVRVIHALRTALVGVKETAISHQRQDLLPPITTALASLAPPSETALV